MIQLGQYPAPSHVIAHISDTHLLAGGKPLFGTANTIAHLEQALAQLERSTAHPQAIVFTGDLADLGEPDAYVRLRGIVEPAAARMNAEIIWVMGNHDERAHYSSLLFDTESDAPQDRVYMIDGLRIISFDTTVPGYHHGAISDAQLQWLSRELATPAPHGTLLAIHHPPIPTPMLEAMGMLELQRQERLAEVLRGSDVRAILAGHLHYSTHSTFVGIPVSVASATCYTLDLSAQDRLLSGVDYGQAVNVVHVYEEQTVHSIIPVGDTTEITGHSAEAWAQIEAMTPEQRLETFSAKNSSFNAH
ncbi:3',5'-cyclic-nucleotide phosphodiesterase [Leifsonia rubra CMS 76R]|uniref:3',5'-cyclic AMP phosphodiesterase CpdA n=1 Tax=Rhodoglobus vestalii TaxID=193384 RepID=A0A8H2K8P3_9MICO|nr:phosphodiesterase [Rhodoglobus vestalii]EPR76834.1 3',5'-cyclic-nucleotide phosphodiesterase [Leifsonia rubra CMS 76R]TQO20913.1 3',5'-cyclic AMP phosphodiesterase CpdA [Rhodoglobus vestalii]